MRADLTLQQMQAFVEVAARSNFREAASALNVSQPALSRTIRMAEQGLGTRLFDRDTRHVALTAAGRELQPIALRILGEFNGAFSELSQFLSGRSGHVATGSLPSTGVAVLPRAVAQFRQTHPDVEFSLIEAQAQPLLEAVDEGRVDVAITVRPAPDRKLRYQALLEDPFVLVCRRDDPLAARKWVPWSVFATRPFLASAQQSSIRPVTDAVFVQQGIQVRPALLYPSIATAGAMIEAGLGITALPRLSLCLIHSGDIAVVPLQRPAMARSIGLVTRIGRTLPPVTHAFVDFLRKEWVRSTTSPAPPGSC